MPKTVVVALNDAHDRVYTLKDGRRVILKGGSSHLRGLKKGVLPAGAYGLTSISEDDWKEIKDTYGNTALFKNELIFVQNTEAKADSQAAEQSSTRHGLEPVDTAKTRTKKAEKEEV